MEPFQNKNIRKAFQMAINPQDIVEYVTKNEEKPARAFVSPGILDSNGEDFREAGGDLVKHDTSEAVKLLEKGLKEENYSKLPPVTLTYSTKPENKKSRSHSAAIKRSARGRCEACKHGSKCVCRRSKGTQIPILAKFISS